MHQSQQAIRSLYLSNRLSFVLSNSLAHSLTRNRHTWFDRDLQVAGRVIVQTSDDSYVEKLVRINRYHQPGSIHRSIE